MKKLHIDYQGKSLNFQGASLLAKGAAKENQMQDPTILAWHRHSTQSMLPYFDGANPDTWWEKYGTGNGGSLEIRVGDDYEFIMKDAGSYEALGEMPLRNLSDGRGNEYICYTPMLGRISNIPTHEACTLLDGWLANQY